ncbi:phosphonate C-P lyase system protein PhnH [Desulfosporosinus sp. BICA1-9]|uniref:phosphonate C-P lyase system protein PhnH n=1 Tax=Desulfosporosinus sp. BICA1-9 TaxID=1531958 RepID=UPI00054C4FC3|nr:phosphonate C-P lyase system protein PhnH [Desulfosporosinus sp. BICA1-9]KJS49657.1 MAG: phosphonate metabolism protein PhnH [Peptococcaceae bacterium BRH_c23]KJS88456.1 MAG: phosphonate metabolism protein PhnH [Desulfosporosinus sp. BICA1-9]HBW34700.1 phosphonate C-P lyase system protein PhnH [Desulfosporosinus sp.]
MNLDLVHDIQAAYRKTLDSMSRPGLIKNIRHQADKVQMESGCFDSTLVLVLMLLDTEVKFKVYSEREAEMAKLINQLTYAKATEVESADYILVLKDAKAEDLAVALRRAYPGDLLNPHKAATMIIEADSVSNERNLSLTGPGIETECYIDVKTSDGWVDLRAEKNSEYPMGIDLIFTDREDNIVCLPRTTQITEQVGG